MNMITADSDVGIVLPLILLISRENNDFSLILALVYIIAA